MQKKLLAQIVAATILGTAALGASAQNAAIVNGKPVPMERLTLLKQQIEERSGQTLPAEMENQLREEVIMREVFSQEAQRRGLERTAGFKNNMDIARQTILIRELFLDFEKNNPISDAEVQAEYDKFVAANSGKEYKASHILVEDEAQAKALLADIQAGKKNFAEVAKKESKDPGSGAQGGDLGWANPSSFVPEFTEVMIKLDKGQLADAPVKTQFGWHIIRVDDVRTAELPKLEEVKPQIVQELGQKKMQKFQEELRAKAKVQ